MGNTPGHDLHKDLSADQINGLRIITAAVRRPAEMICTNAGVEGRVMVHKMIEKESATYGYDVARDKWCDFFEDGIIDPVLVVQTALTNAASVASMMLTTEAAVVDSIDEKPEAPMGGGGMGGMGGMGDMGMGY